MAELRIQIPDELVTQMQEKLGSNVKVTDIARDAITLYNWAIGERYEGRLIMSSDPKGEDPARLTMTSIESAAIKGAKK